MAVDLGADYKRLRRSSTLAAFGEGLLAVALPLLVVGLSPVPDPLAVAGVVAVQHVPWVVLAAAGSRMLRTIDRRTTIGAIETVRAIVIGFVGYRVLVDSHTLLHLYAVALVVGIGEILRDDGEADGADALAHGDEQPGVIGGLSGRGMAALGIALLVGGFLYGTLAAVPLLVNLGILSLAALAVLSVRRPVPPTSSGTAGSAVESLRRGDGLVRGAVLPTAVAALATAATSAVLGILALFATQEESLALGAPGFGLLLALLAGGAAIGGLASPGIGGRIGIRAALVALLAVTAGGYAAAAALASPEHPYLAATALVVSSSSAMAAGVVVRALLHAGAGRLLEQPSMHVFHLVVWTAIPVGALAGGLAGRALGVPAVLVVAALTAGVAAGLGLLVRPRTDHDDPERDTGPQPGARSVSPI